MPDHSYADLDLDAQLCFPLYAASRAVTRAYHSLLADSGLTYPQYVSMLALWGSGGPLSVGELGTRLGLDSGTLTPLLKRLEGAGFVVRRRDGADERRVLVEVTELGWSLRDDVAGVPADLGSRLGFSAAEGKELRSLLDRVIANVGGPL